MWAEVRREYLPPDRPRQLAFFLDCLRLPPAHPVRKTDQARLRARPPTWFQRSGTAQVHDDLDLCPEQIASQLGLFATPPRHFDRSHAFRLQGREISDLRLLVTALEEIARERGVLSDSWLRETRPMAVLALAAREPGERAVRAETLPDLPEMHPTIGQALARAGLLAPKRPRVVPASRFEKGSCAHCLAWGNDQRKICTLCWSWSRNHGVGQCRRCCRTLPLDQELCRFCRLVLAETSTDLSGAALVGGDQLWLGGPFALQLSTANAEPSTRSQGRHAAKRRQARRVARLAQPLSMHLVDPAQGVLFDAAIRDWRRLTEADLPRLTDSAAALAADFNRYVTDRGWKIEDVRGSIRVLRILVAHLGADAPIREVDVRALAASSSNHQGARVIDYLRRQGLLVSDQAVDADLARARSIAASLTPKFADMTSAWIDVLTGQGSRPSRTVSNARIYGYIQAVVPILRQWSAAGVGDLREITKDDIEAALQPLEGSAARSVHVGLRSLFRALKRERLIFRDPARKVILKISRRLPASLPTDQLRGLLDHIPDTRSRLIVALIAIHALRPGELRTLLLDDLDRSLGRLSVRRQGRPDHVVFLEEITLNLATAWVCERSRQWSRTTNPHLFVTRQTAASDHNPPLSDCAIRRPFSRLGLKPGQLREDRLLDEAKETADPVHLMRVFGVSSATAIRYVAAAHPADIRPDPIAP